jgi:hypothetical protein
VKALLDAILQHRRRFAPLVLGLGGAVVFLTVQRATPHVTHVHLRFAAQNDVREVELAYLVGDEAAVTSTFRYDEKAPVRVDSDPSLSPGRYTVRISLTHASRVEALERALTVPTDGAVTFDLSGVQ